MVSEVTFISVKGVVNKKDCISGNDIEYRNFTLPKHK